MIEAVTYDFWNTIVRVPGEEIAAARLRAVVDACERAAVPVEGEALARHLEQVGGSRRRAWLTGEHFHPHEGARRLVAALKLEGESAEQVTRAFLTGGLDLEFEFAPDFRLCASELRERGIHIGIVCDAGFMTGERLRALLADEELLNFFSGWGFSDEVGHYKPAPQIFEEALSRLRVKPGHAIHVGDLHRTDIAGAAGVGMRSARFRAFQDDPLEVGAVDPDFILDRHCELLEIVDRLV